MKKILITGALGYTGRYITNALVESGYHVVASDYYNENYKKLSGKMLQKSLATEGKLDFYWCRLQSDQPFEKLLEADAFDAVIHLAYVIPPYSEEDPSFS